MVGGTTRRASAGAEPQARQTPRLGAPEERGDETVVGGADGENDVAGSSEQTRRLDDVAALHVHRRQRSLADDHWVHELDGDVTTVGSPPR